MLPHIRIRGLVTTRETEVHPGREILIVRVECLMKMIWKLKDAIKATFYEEWSDEEEHKFTSVLDKIYVYLQHSNKG